MGGGAALHVVVVGGAGAALHVVLGAEGSVLLHVRALHGHSPLPGGALGVFPGIMVVIKQVLMEHMFEIHQCVLL